MKNSIKVATALTAFYFGMFLAAGVSAHPAWGIAVDQQGRVYFSDLKSVWKIDLDGKVSMFRRGTDSHTHEINLDETGNVIGAENSYVPATQKFYSGIWRMTPAGEFSYMVPMAERLPTGTSIWKDWAGNSYHVGRFQDRDLLVLKRSPDGRVTVLAGSETAAPVYKQTGSYGIGAVAFGPDQSIYFLHGPNVGRVGPGGKGTPVAATVKSEGELPVMLFGLAVDALGNALTADFESRRVIRIAPDGKQTTILREGAPWHPSGVAVRGDNIYVLESGTRPDHTPTGETRVVKVGKDGKTAVIATVNENGNAAATGASNADGPNASPAGDPVPRPFFSGALLAAAVPVAVLLLGIGFVVGRAFAGRP